MMERSDSLRWGLLFGLLLVTVLGGGLLFQNRDAQPSRTVSSLSSGPLGLDLFQDFLEKIDISTRIQKRALFDKPREELLILAGPHLEISEREMKVIRDYVSSGHTIFLSAHDGASVAAVERLGRHLESEHRVTKRDDYRDGEVLRLSGSASLGLLPAADLAFYSPYRLNDGSCARDSRLCYYRETTLGKGKIILQLGLPLFSNALMGMEENRQFALRLAEQFESVVFDEYHHFAQEKSLSDLLTDVQVALPLYGLVFMAGLYCLFGDLRPGLRRGLAEPKPRVPDYLELREQLVRGIVHKPSKRELVWHWTQLSRLYPGKQAPRAQSDNTLREGLSLILFHQAVLKERRGYARTKSNEGAMES